MKMVQKVLTIILQYCSSKNGKNEQCCQKRQKANKMLLLWQRQIHGKQLPQGKNEQLLNVSASQRYFSVENSEKNPLKGGIRGL